MPARYSLLNSIFLIWDHFLDIVLHDVIHAYYYHWVIGKPHFSQKIIWYFSRNSKNKIVRKIVFMYSINNYNRILIHIPFINII